MNILIAGHDLKFIQFYIEYLNKTEHKVKIDKWENHNSHDIKYSFEMLEWADVILCEWGLGNTVFYSKHKRARQRLIVRLHRQELQTSHLHEANLKKIDSIICVSPYIYEEFTRTFGLSREKMNMIYNHVSADKFMNQNHQNKFNLGMVGYLPKLKRLDLALDILEELYQFDQRYTLYLKGKRPDELAWLMRLDEERQYFEQQFERINNAVWKDNIIFESFGEVAEFYNKLEFILSLSDVESFHLAAAEGMACGAVPIIMNWEGSNTIYSPEFILDDKNEVLNFIKYKRENEEVLQTKMQHDVAKFDQDKIIEKMNHIVLNSLGDNIHNQKSVKH